MDSKEPQEKTYVLRKPIKAWEYSSEELETQIPIYQYGKDDPELLTVMKDIWNEFFVEFDEDATRKQIFEDKELFRLASLIGCDGEDWQIERRKNNLVDYVFSLITGETK